MTGTGRRVLRILSVTAFLALVAAGCGSSGRSPRQAAPVLPRALAQEWATRATAVANAAGAGDNCRALQLASSLRNEIIADEGKIPDRLQKPLVQSANALAERITCTVPPRTVTLPPTPQHGPKPPDHKPPHHHDHGKHGGDGGNQQ
jgi:hypothetical protein